MLKKKELISVIVPTYNRKHCIMKNINSVFNQDSKCFDYEIIVVDDGSTDGTSELFKKKNKKIKYYQLEKNSGVNVARNYAIHKAKGKYVLFLDSDDSLSDNAFRVLKRYESKLTDINFFGTKEEKTNKNMYYILRTGKYSYKDWLEGKIIRGEFLALVKRKIFEIDMFDEERFCFETFFWNKIIKKYGVSAFDEVLRLYSFEPENRISKRLQDPKKALKRHSDYLEYLRRFESDFRKYNLKKQLSDIYFSTGYYACLSGNMNEGRRYFRKGNKEKISIKNIIGLILSRFNKFVFIKLAMIIEYNS